LVIEFVFYCDVLFFEKNSFFRPFFPLHRSFFASPWPH
jgi:hypothetical protein